MVCSQEMQLLDSVSGADTNASDETSQDDLVGLFSKSKQGWRLKPTTARRQERQLRNLFAEVSDSAGPSEIIRHRLDDIENVLLGKLPGQSASVKSTVIALLEFERFVSVREPQHAAEWDASRRRLETWKRDASSMDLHREASLQDKMGEDGYLPSRDQLKTLRDRVEEEIPRLASMKKEDIRRNDAVRMRRNGRAPATLVEQML